MPNKYTVEHVIDFYANSDHYGNPQAIRTDEEESIITLDSGSLAELAVSILHMNADQYQVLNFYANAKNYLTVNGSIPRILLERGELARIYQRGEKL